MYTNEIFRWIHRVTRHSIKIRLPCSGLINHFGPLLTQKSIIFFVFTLCLGVSDLRERKRKLEKVLPLLLFSSFLRKEYKRKRGKIIFSKIIKFQRLRAFWKNESSNFVVLVVLNWLLINWSERIGENRVFFRAFFYLTLCFCAFNPHVF